LVETDTLTYNKRNAQHHTSSYWVDMRQCS